MTARRTSIVAACCLALASLVAWSAPRIQDAASAPSAAPAADEEVPVKVTLDDLAALVGTWEAQPIWEAAGTYHVRTTFAWALDERFLQEDREITIGDEITKERILYGLDPATGVLQRFHFASNGTLGRLADVSKHAHDDLGRLVAVADDGTQTPFRFVFEGVLEGAWPVSPWRFTLTIKDHEHFDLVVARKPGAAFLELTKQGFTRVDDDR